MNRELGTLNLLRPMKIGNWIKRLFHKGTPGERLSPDDIESLRTAFKARYHNFKLLLNANNKALEIMSEVQEALRGATPFGMTFVRSRCTSITTNVFQIIKHLNELAPKRYELLLGRFEEIRKRISPFLEPGEFPKDGPLVLSLREVGKDLADQVGAKAANLGEVSTRLHLNIPNGFVVTAAAYQRFMEHNDLQTEIDRRIQTSEVERLDRLHELSAQIQQLIIRASLPADLEEGILEHYRSLEMDEGKGVALAMRSSALGEDLQGISFAGQYRSELNVSSENIVRAYKEILASKYSLQAITYRLNRGIRDEDVAMCVACMTMVDPVSGGVTYSRNPLNIRDDSIVVNSVWGLPKSVVDGSAPSDLFVVSRGEPMAILQKTIPSKDHKFVCYPREGVCRLDMTGDEMRLPSLSDEQALEIALLAIRIEEYCKAPQDIEWAVRRDGTIILLQCRPLQQMDVLDKAQSRIYVEREIGRVVLRGGAAASPGVGAGPVFVAKKDMDALRFPDGAVLVAAQASPRWASLLNKASAVITEQGGIAGHLANVAREFGVPALLGVKGAMQRLSAGQMVTVDADGHSVYDGHIDALLKAKEPPKNLMQGSPVYESLKGSIRHITPLNLLDPDSPEFKPHSCKTFHDITRFCHEKAVLEMFSFGKNHHFPERSSKQLYCDGPMQFWVINLDDGFSEEVTDRWILLENICSVPMLSLWQGMIAVPWKGPPPLDSRGFMSVLFEATVNPALDPSTGASYGMRNYFMISRNFCSLQSRFGFHFSIVEALVGKRAIENYISFQFKGGAADLQRRIFRARFLIEILDQYDFRTEIREDAAFARLEGYEQSLMEERLRVLGYLIIHTRQLDMIMANSAAMSRQRQKILKDLRDVVVSNHPSFA